ncbi:MAG: GNAT family N-acetyltransferase [Bacteriovorax sp.]
MKIRKAIQSEFDQIYLMGLDVWAEGPEEEYLTACRTSPKYEKGTWYVLGEGAQLLSSLILYQLGEGKFGIGSIATPKALRKRGYGSKLLSEVINLIESSSSETFIFLYSDIEPEFYEKFKFVKIPPIAQRYKTTTCMVRGQNIGKFFNDKLTTPEYF